MSRRRRMVLAGVGVVAAGLLLPLITIRSARALQALEAGLGRSVHADAVHLRLFPLPGVELDNVRLGEDPAFGAEDMVVADDATAAVRLSSLLTGRLVFARIHLDGASINLVRNAAGEWNIAALLDRTGQLSAAAGQGPGGDRRARPAVSRFPYIDWSDARINFKLDDTKTRFYLDQVEGSLARDAAGWRLQARFVPERTDLNLSNTGEVTLDGRWPSASGGNFRQRPFELALRLDNSYLAGSSALLAGHDAGVHGILSAQIQVQGGDGSAGDPGADAGAPGFRVTGAVQAQSLRRWDLLPPPAAVSGAFAGQYYPAEDRFVLAHAGEPGFQHLDLQGEVSNLFTRPSAQLRLSLRDFSAAGLLPLVMAIKAHLPAHLEAGGVANGAAQLQWTPSQTPALTGKASVSLSQFRLSADQQQFTLPAATLAWDGRRLQLPAAAASIGPTAARVSAEVDRRGFEFHFDSASFTAAAAQGLAGLFGIRSPWPPRLSGEAELHLGIASDWDDFRQAGWSGTVSFPTARFLPDGDGGEDSGNGLRLTDVAVTFADPRPLQVSFRTRLADPDADGGSSPVSGNVSWAAGAGPQFELYAEQLRAGAVWELLHPPPQNLVQRVFGGVTPGWISGLSASGSVRVEDLNWNGVHAGVRMQIEAAPSQWLFPRLSISFGRGLFVGGGQLNHGAYQITGSTSPSGAIPLAMLLEGSAFQGVVAGQLSGSLALTRPLGTGLEQSAADGEFLVRHGQLSTSTGVVPFDRFAAVYHLRQGVAALSQVIWITPAGRWQGQGTATLAGNGPLGFDLQLERQGQRLHLKGTFAAAASSQ